MAAVYMDEGLTGLLKKRNGDAAGKEPASLRLYTALSGSLTEARVKADFTEASGMSYGFAAIASGDWSYNLDTTNHWLVGTVTKGWTFTAGAGLTLLGWYVLNQGATNVVLAEAFSSSIVIPAGGGTLSVTVNDKYKLC